MPSTPKFQNVFFLGTPPEMTTAFVRRPWRERLRFALAVFFLFCTVGTLTVFINHTATPMPLYFVLLVMFVSGTFAGVLVLIIGRFVLMLVWVALFATTMIFIGSWGTSLQKKEQAEFVKQNAVFTNEESRTAVEAYRQRVRAAITRDVILTLLLTVSSYIAFVLAFNHEWERRSEVESELKVAKRIQESLLPPAEKRIASWRMFGVLRPANTVAGDYFDYLEFAGDKVGVLVADASGHGVAAGLVMTMIKSQLLLLASENYDSQKFFERLNRCVRTLAPKNMFVTAALAVFNKSDSSPALEIEIVTAGHPPVLHYAAATQRVEELHTAALALGLQSAFVASTARVVLQTGDTLLLHTDGLFEQMNLKQNQWGLERLKAAFARHHDLPLEKLCARLMEEVNEFRAYAPIKDDMTLVAIRREA